MAVARVRVRATVDRAAPAPLVLGHVRGDPQTAYIPDEVARVVGPVGANGRGPANAAFEYHQRGFAFGGAVGFGQFDIDDQTVTVPGQLVT